jgi:serine/threonine-protein kinase
MKLRQAAPLLDELLSALSAAHAVGVIHRDLKPGNVFVESKPDGQKGIKVIDFGLAKQADRAGGSVKPTNPGTLLGTPAFMAPEQVLGTKVTPATDLYAVGGIAYQMLTNHLPHEAPSAIEVLSQKMAHDPIRPRQWQPTVDDDLDGWVMNLLSREPEKRYQDADEARRALRRITDGRTSSASGNRPALHRPVATGVVPKREWSEAKTLVTEGLSPEKAAELSTGDHVSPWATTSIEHPSAVPESESEPTLPPVARPRVQSSRVEAPTMVANPEEVARAQPAKKRPESKKGMPVVDAPAPAPLPVEAGPGEQTDLQEPHTAPPPSRIPLYIALLSAIIALLCGLIWLYWPLR